MNATTTAAPDAAAQKRLDRAKRLIAEMLNRTEERGFSEAEAMEAAQKIGAMLQQYDLELDDIVARDTSDMVTVEAYAADTCMGSIIVGISRLCSLKVYSKTGAAVATYVMFGHKPDTELAMFLYEVCASAADHGWQQHMDRHGYSKKARDSYRTGFSGRVHGRMLQLRQQRDNAAAAGAKRSGCTALLVVKDQVVEEEFGKLGIKLGKTRRAAKVHNATAYYAGQQHADTVNLNNPLGSDRQGQGSLA